MTVFDILQVSRLTESRRHNTMQNKSTFRIAKIVVDQWPYSIDLENAY